MKPSALSRLALALAFAAGLSLAPADTIKLKNGTVLEGNITSDTADSYEIEVNAGKGIKDFQKIKKTDVAEVIRVKPDEKEALELMAKLDPPKDGLTAADYDKAIKTDIQPWLDKNKVSTKRKDIEALLKLYNDELAKVKAGDIKLRGTWISVEEKKWNEYNVNARKLRLKFEDLLKAKKYPEAYAAFAQMEVSGGAGVDFPPVVEAMIKALPQLEAAIGNAITAQPNLEKDRKAALAALPPDQKKNEDERIKKERADWAAKVVAEKKDKIRIPSFYPYELKTIQDALTALKKETDTLKKLDLVAMTAANKKFEQGLKDLNGRAFLSAKGNFDAAAKFHSKDPAVKAKLDEATKAATAPPAKPAAVPPAVKPAGK